MSDLRQFFYVSIHAPARGATDIMPLGLPLNPVSIHAPARGATAQDAENRFMMLFQSTLPRGERRRPTSDRRKPFRCFNPRSRAGSDKRDMEKLTPFEKFQSTLPRGERPIIRHIFTKRHQFQSTLPRGERPGNGYLHVKLSKFQSTLPRGERHTCYN